MKVIALVMAIIMGILYLKSLKSLFKSPWRIKEEFKKSLEVQYEKSGKEAIQITMIIVTLLYGAFTLLYYVVTATATGSMLMVVLASLLVVMNAIHNSRLIFYVLEATEDLKLGIGSKLASIVGFGYIIAFFILFFI